MICILILEDTHSHVTCVVASLLTNEKYLGKLLKMFQMYIWCGFIIKLKYSKETNFREKLLQKPVTSLFARGYRNLYILEYHVTSGFSLRVIPLNILFGLKKRFMVRVFFCISWGIWGIILRFKTLPAIEPFIEYKQKIQLNPIYHGIILLSL